MSIRKHFSKKARVAAASLALAFGAAGGGYVGHEAAQHYTQPQVSQFTLAQLPDTMTERQFYSGKIPDGAATDLQQPTRVDEFTQRVDVIAAAQGDMARYTLAVDFINDLRMAENLSEQNYKDLLADYNTRVGIDVSATTGNYELGIMYMQEAQLGTFFGAMFGDDLTDAEMSKDIGDTMARGQKMHDATGLAGGAAGGALGGLLLLPLLVGARRRDPHIKLPLPPKNGG